MQNKYIKKGNIYGTCNCKIQDISKYKNDLMQNMILNNNMKFCFICPICDQQLLDEEVKFLLGDQISYTTVNKIN